MGSGSGGRWQRTWERVGTPASREACGRLRISPVISLAPNVLTRQVSYRGDLGCRSHGVAYVMIAAILEPQNYDVVIGNIRSDPGIVHSVGSSS